MVQTSGDQTYKIPNLSPEISADPLLFEHPEALREMDVRLIDAMHEILRQ